MPTTAFIADGRFHDVGILDRLLFEPGAIYIFDRASEDFDFRWLRSSSPDPRTGVRCDQTIAPGGI